MSESASITGRWRITEMDNWDQEAIDLVQPGFIEFGEDGLGSLGFIVVTGDLDCRDADRDGQPGAEFSWQGSDEGDDARPRLGRTQPRASSTSCCVPFTSPSAMPTPTPRWRKDPG